MLDTRKSRESRIPFPPSIVVPLRILFSRAQGRERRRRSTKFTPTLFFLSQPKLSMKDATIFSNTAITVLRDAKDMKAKNRVPQTLPPFMLMNTLGRVIKIRDGPLSGAML